MLQIAKAYEEENTKYELNESERASEWAEDRMDLKIHKSIGWLVVIHT